MLQEDIKQQIIEAMKARDTLRTSVLKDISAYITNTLIAKKKKPTDTLSDDEVVMVIKRLIKQRKDAIMQYEKGGRDEQAQAEKDEMAILQEYVAPEMPDTELQEIIDSVVSSTDKKDMGLIMKEVMQKVGNNADGSRVSAMVRSTLQ